MNADSGTKSQQLTAKSGTAAELGDLRGRLQPIQRYRGRSWLTPKELAAKLRVNVSMIHRREFWNRLVDEGVVVCEIGTLAGKGGRAHRLFDEESVDAWIERHRVDGHVERCTADHADGRR